MTPTVTSQSQSWPSWLVILPKTSSSFPRRKADSTSTECDGTSRVSDSSSGEWRRHSLSWKTCCPWRWTSLSTGYRLVLAFIVRGVSSGGSWQALPPNRHWPPQQNLTETATFNPWRAAPSTFSKQNAASWNTLSKMSRVGPESINNITSHLNINT